MVRSWVVLLALAALSCQGRLVVPEHYGQIGQLCADADECAAGLSCRQGTCQAGESCSPLSLDGTCPPAYECREGSCVPRGYCDCLTTEACVDGQCVDPELEEPCSQEALSGACRGDAVCVAGNCVPIDDENRCEASRPDGLCPDGLACSRGVCRPIDEVPCDSAHPEGRCAAGYACSAAGVCEVLACGPLAQQGACPGGQFCDAGVCVDFPCSSFHPAGVCPEGSWCSAARLCVPVGGCAVAADCPDGRVCSSVGVCVVLGACVADVDCGSFYRCASGTCVRDPTCTMPGDCFPNEKCSTSGQCIALTSCMGPADCPAGEKCSSGGACIDADACLDVRDCPEADFCSASRRCIADGTCALAQDCPPAHDCGGAACVLAGPTCDAHRVYEGCAPGVFECCPEGKECCASTQRCSLEVGRCLEPPRCLEDADCVDGTSCNERYICESDAPCPVSCDTGERCSAAAQACIPLGGCFADADCADGERCSGGFVCVPADNCGATQLETTLVPPNVLIVLDRSGSMNWCDTDSVTRWAEASQIITAVVTAESERLRFGFSSYPRQCRNTPPCNPECGPEPALDCDGTFCTTDGEAIAYEGGPLPAGVIPNRQPGVVEVAVGPATAPAIIARLATIEPGGSTPTGPTLRNVAANRAGFGLASTDRDNVIVLVTDGEANRDFDDVAGCSPLCTSDCDRMTTQDCNGCEGGATAACKVDSALDALRSASPSIKTYVVGFAFETVHPYLNCHAVRGGTSLCAPSVDATSCGSSAQACYYQANNAALLAEALHAIAAEVASCSYTLGQEPPDLSKLYVFADYGAGVPSQLARDQAHGNGWDWNPQTLQVTFYGAACDALKAGTATPIVVYGCPDQGG